MPTLSGADLGPLIDIATRLADAAAGVTLRHFRTRSLDLSSKDAGRFDPVTVADRGAEEAMRAVLERARPDDGVFGEEGDRIVGTSGLTWVLDPIDGTRAYISGVPVWGTLIGLDDGERGRIGIIDQPFTGERFVGVVDGDASLAELRHRGAVQALTTRPCGPLDRAVMFTTDPDLFDPAEIEGFRKLRSRCRLTRYGTDCYAYALLAAGHIDLVVEAGLNAYDVASHIPLITAAGGVVTDWRGGDCRWGGRVIAAGDAETHAAALEILSQVP